MDVDPSGPGNQPPKKHSKVEALQALTSGPLRSSLSKLSASSRAIPSDKDFHFYYNFDEFKLPVKEIVTRSESVLDRIGAAGDLLGKVMSFPRGDTDEGYDWLVGVSDEIFERFDSSVDEFERARKKREEGVLGMEDDGFQLVCGRSKKVNPAEGGEKIGGENLSQPGVKMAFKDKKTLGAKPRVPFHIPTIRRPQEEYKVLVNNANQPFEHVWLERSEDGSRFVHPLEKLSVSDFVDKNVGVLKPVEPPSIECTPFKLIQEVKDLKELSAKLRVVDEFSVDLEHNQYRSFQGLTCLMQISTRTEDFIVDTLKLRVHVGPYLREVFKDPTKKKVMHGADRDILWLQRDFGIYICNLFDTGQASRELKLERNSLEYLLHHFCGVSANKEYQNADWRLRPLPEEMIRYAREDTHYLLYIFDLLKIELTKMPKDHESADDPLLEVYKRSYDICMQFYEKELLTENSYLYIYGLQGSNFNAQQLAIVAGLCEWRDGVARAEDESTGYILPNKTLLEIATQMPVTVGKLRRLVKSKHPYVERNIGAVLSIIFHAIQNASAFEAVAEQLKQGVLNVVQEETIPVEDLSASASMEVEGPSISPVPVGVTTNGYVTCKIEDKSIDFAKTPHGICKQEGLYGNVDNQSNRTAGSYAYAPAYPSENTAIPMSSGTEIVETTTSGQSAKVSATVQVAKKPSRAFGALFGTGPIKKSNQNATDKGTIKLEQIKSAVNLPFHQFTGMGPLLKPLAKEEQMSFGVGRDEDRAQPPPMVANGALEEIIVLEDETRTEEPANVIEGNSSADAEQEVKQEDNGTGTSDNDEDEDEPTALSELSSSFRKCFQPRQPHKPKEPSALLNFKPFDYEEARQQIKFGNSRLAATGGGDDNEAPGHKAKKKNASATTSKERRIEESGGFQPGRRSQAFPATGNRSSTFKSP